MIEGVDLTDELSRPVREHNPFGRFLRFLAIVSGWVLIALTLYTVGDVVMRYIFNAPFRSSLEVTQFLMAIIVFLGLAYCGWAGGHVAVDIFERKLESPALRWVPPLLTFISAALFGVIALCTLDEALETTYRLSNMLRWPHYPFMIITAAGSALYAIVLVIQAIRELRKP